MAIVAGVQAGKTPYQIAGATGAAPLRLGASIGSDTAASTLTLPTDPQGNAYAAYLITASANVWFAWTTGSGSATIGGNGSYLIGYGSQLPTVAPVGATSINWIYDGASTTGGICITGLY